MLYLLASDPLTFTPISRLLTAPLPPSPSSLVLPLLHAAACSALPAAPSAASLPATHAAGQAQVSAMHFVSDRSFAGPTGPDCKRTRVTFLVTHH